MLTASGAGAVAAPADCHCLMRSWTEFEWSRSAGFEALLFGVVGALRRMFDDRRGVEGVVGICAEGEMDQSSAFMLAADI